MEDYSFAPQKNERASLTQSRFKKTVKSTPKNTDTSIYFPWDLKNGGFCLNNFTLPDQLKDSISEGEIKSLITSFNE